MVKNLHGIRKRGVFVVLGECSAHGVEYRRAGHWCGERFQAIQHAEQALTIYEQIKDPNTAKVRSALATWREQTDT